VQAAGVSELQGSLKDVRSGLNELESSLEKYVPPPPLPRMCLTPCAGFG
jgi:hypothetical protein